MQFAEITTQCTLAEIMAYEWKLIWMIYMSLYLFNEIELIWRVY